MTLDLDSFLDQLAKWLVSQAAALSPAVTLKYDQSTPRDLWIYEAAETVDGASVYSVLAIYSGGSTDQSQATTVPVQISTRGTDQQLVMQRACLLHGLFFDKDTKFIVRNVTMTGMRFLGPTNLRPPAMIGRDEQHGWQAVSNFDAVVTPG